VHSSFLYLDFRILHPRTASHDESTLKSECNILKVFIGAARLKFGKSAFSRSFLVRKDDLAMFWSLRKRMEK
jgi:hypothetical protein